MKEYQQPYQGLKVLIKLHGAIWYFKQGFEIIKTINDPKNIPFQLEIGEQMMIYPTKEKPILRQPYSFFYEAFKDQQWNCLIVIGYSFRDDPVNTVILEQLEKGDDCQIYLIDPEADETVYNFPNYEQYASRFHLIPIEFGKKGYEDEFYNAIDPALRRKSF